MSFLNFSTKGSRYIKGGSSIKRKVSLTNTNEPFLQLSLCLCLFLSLSVSLYLSLSVCLSVYLSLSLCSVTPFLSVFFVLQKKDLVLWNLITLSNHFVSEKGLSHVDSNLQIWLLQVSDFWKTKTLQTSVKQSSVSAYSFGVIQVATMWMQQVVSVYVYEWALVYWSNIFTLASVYDFKSKN